MLPDNFADSIVTDPPYGLSFMGRKWDYDVPAVEVWAECLRVLKPGGHLLAFAGTRTQHRMAVRIEDAGFEIRDMIAWVYGSGFPKSLDVSKAIDKAAGAERERYERPAFGGTFSDDKGTTYGTALSSIPATDAAREWQGWGTALKPALEPITVARKPFAGTVAENVLEHGTGALNIDGSRVGTRWPANLIHDGSDEVLAAFPQAPGQLAKASTSDTQRAGQNVYGDMVRGSEPFEPRKDTGSAARFFYCAKASKSDRGEGNGHPTVKPTDLMRYLCRLVTPPGGMVLDPYVGSGTTGKAAALEGFRFIGFEREAEYVAIARARIAAATQLTREPA